VGTIAFLSKVRTIDLLGLTEPRARQFLRARDYAWAIRDSPSYVFANENAGQWPVALAIFQLPEFALNYRPVARFRFREGNDYVIYRRSHEARPVTSADPWKAEWLDLHYPSSITHSEMEIYSVVVRNLSSAVWQPDSDDAIYVTYHWYDASGVADISEGERTALPCAVEPGKSILASARVTAPASAGKYVLQWDLFRKGYGYFSDHGLVVPGEVVVVR
jgi:uncharacterized protein YcfL